eukprot:352549_1
MAMPMAMSMSAFGSKSFGSKSFQLTDDIEYINIPNQYEYLHYNRCVLFTVVIKLEAPPSITEYAHAEDKNAWILDTEAKRKDTTRQNKLIIFTTLNRYVYIE